MVCFFYYLWLFILGLYIYSKFKNLSNRYNIAIDALRKISSTDYDMNKLVGIAIKALKDIDNL